MLLVLQKNFLMREIIYCSVQMLAVDMLLNQCSVKSESATTF
jgi:hypothetical protein